MRSINQKEEVERLPFSFKKYPQGTRPNIPKGPAAVPKKTVNKEKGNKKN